MGRSEIKMNKVAYIVKRSNEIRNTEGCFLNKKITPQNITTPSFKSKKNLNNVNGAPSLKKKLTNKSCRGIR